jgi:nitrate reductase alpha subunit
VLGGLKKSYTKAALTAAQKNLIVNGLYLKNSYDTIKKKVSKYYDIPSIVALKEGTTYVRATLNGKTYKIKVTVKADLVDCNKADSVYPISTECE